jgi:subtilisin family serine protease
LNSPRSTFITPLDLPADELPNFFGTSSSAPHAAAVAALMLQKNSSLTPQQVRKILQETAHGPVNKRFTSARPAELNPITLINGYNFDAGTGSSMRWTP